MSTNACFTFSSYWIWKTVLYQEWQKSPRVFCDATCEEVFVKLQEEDLEETVMATSVHHTPATLHVTWRLPLATVSFSRKLGIISTSIDGSMSWPCLEEATGSSRCTPTTGQTATFVTTRCLLNRYVLRKHKSHHKYSVDMTAILLLNNWCLIFFSLVSPWQL